MLINKFIGLAVEFVILFLRDSSPHSAALRAVLLSLTILEEAN